MLRLFYKVYHVEPGNHLYRKCRMFRIAIPLDIVHIIYDHVDRWNTRLAIALTCKELNRKLQGSVTNLAFQVFPTENDKACKLAYNTTTVAMFDLHNSSFYLN
ncbi:unnamed protein product [Umbelopsis ramanniana]